MLCLYKFIFAEALIYQKYFINMLFFFLFFSISFHHQLLATQTLFDCSL